ncbi:hypothetical protein AwDysgo_20540 [Bacteroidales bacterium]|nr:hypothetical protein AwDysgo_20540 [Bacteroidales bacterium]
MLGNDTLEYGTLSKNSNPRIKNSKLKFKGYIAHNGRGKISHSSRLNSSKNNNINAIGKTKRFVARKITGNC